MNAGYDVVFNYIIGIEKYNELREVFKNVDFKFIVLLANENSLLKRDRERPEDCQMKDRCIILLNNFRNFKYDESHILHTDNLKINETVNEIISNERFLVK